MTTDTALFLPSRTPRRAAGTEALASPRRACGACGLALALLGIAIGAAAAQGSPDAYPSRPVRLVVGFAAGGGNDILARIIGDRLAKAFGQPFIVENKPGFGGGLAAAFVANQPPDGYTLLVGPSGPMAVAPAVYSKMAYDTLRDFAPISLVGTFPMVLLANTDNSIKSVGDLVAWSKANPSKGSYASSSPAFTLTVELLKLRTGAQLQRVSYRSTNEGVLAVLSGQTTTTLVDTSPAVSLVREGKLRALAVTTSKRAAELPETPTMEEAGVPGFDITLWTGIFARTGTPADVLAKLEHEIRRIAREPEVRERLRALAVDPVGSSGAEFRERIAAEIASWTAIAKAAQVSIDP